MGESSADSLDSSDNRFAGEEKLIQSTTTESTEVLKSISHFVEKWKGVNIAKEGTKFGRDEPRITALTNQLDDRISSFDTLHHLLSSR